MTDRQAGGAAGEPGRFPPGARVRTTLVDPPHHTRIPRYVRGRVGTIVEPHGAYPLPDDRVRDIPDVRVETVYTVSFAARDLWGAGDHTVTVDLWESYLRAADPENASTRLEQTDER